MCPIKIHVFRYGNNVDIIFGPFPTYFSALFHPHMRRGPYSTWCPCLFRFWCLRSDGVPHSRPQAKIDDHHTAEENFLLTFRSGARHFFSSDDVHRCKSVFQERKDAAIQALKTVHVDGFHNGVAGNNYLAQILCD